MIEHYTLQEIANWAQNGHVAIPALQRGLVWSPAQVELLWDSLLRGFPVGSFAMTPVVRANGQQTKRTAETAEYFLMDGQQRCNAIQLGFEKITAGSAAALWVDLAPSGTGHGASVVNSTRRFWVKVTTKAHPWGYRDDDNCGILSWREIRDAIAAFCKENPGLTGDDPRSLTLDKTWPYESYVPVPLASLMADFQKAKLMCRESAGTVADRFVECVKSQEYFHKAYARYESEIDSNLVDCTLHRLGEAFQRLENYRIVANVLDMDIVSDKDSQDGMTSSLEHLFYRMNRNGTPMSDYDVRYSAIKAYWGSIKDANDDCAANRMPAAHLAVLAVRLALTEENIAKGKFELAATPSINDIRKLGRQRELPAARRIEELYANNGRIIQCLIDGVETKLGVATTADAKGLPPVLRTSIVLNSSDVYLLLLVLEAKNLLTGKFACGLALDLHWFAKGDKRVLASSVLSLAMKKESIERSAIVRQYNEIRGQQEEPLVGLVSSEELSALLKRKPFGPDWDLSQLELSEPMMVLYNRVAWNREMLIYAEREYFNAKFDYDPAMTDFFKGHNAPWDYDHIIPKSWVAIQGRVGGEWKQLCQKWVWNIGNFAAIPLSVNRSKNDKAEWTEYLENKEGLLFDERLSNVFGAGNSLTSDGKAAQTFVELTLARMVKIYGRCFDMIMAAYKVAD